MTKVRGKTKRTKGEGGKGKGEGTREMIIAVSLPLSPFILPLFAVQLATACSFWFSAATFAATSGGASA
jgi:hypothetical protein